MASSGMFTSVLESIQQVEHILGTFIHHFQGFPSLRRHTHETAVFKDAHKGVIGNLISS